ncbi:TonB-dependent receptor [Saprospira grandis str. Lewin]|uniref:TonB-dependent receptor n=2 Tax=Saprospira TaxID=1007 RepID=H6KZL3_SAPGL|nr:TonB-dependent receptor [Saprospira grandis str. Lewin]
MSAAKKTGRAESEPKGERPARKGGAAPTKKKKVDMNYLKISSIFSFLLWRCGLQLLNAQTPPTADSLLLEERQDEAVIVSGEFLPIGQAKAIEPLQLISLEEIRRRAALVLDELLQQQLNIRIQQDGVLGSQIEMQGLSGRYINVLVDGVPLVGRQDGQLDLGRMGLENLKQVEIVEGPMSVLYGSNALGGTIQLVTQDFIKEGWQAGGHLLGESKGRYQGSAYFGGRYKAISGRINYRYLNWAGYGFDSLRSQAFNPKTQHDVQAFLRWDAKKLGQFRYRIGGLLEEIKQLGDTRLPDFPSLSYANDYTFTTRSLDQQLSWKKVIDERYHLQAFLANNLYERQKNAYRQPLGENPEALRQDSLDSDTSAFSAWHFRAVMATEFREVWDFQAGLDFRQEAALGQRLKEDSEQGDYAAFGVVRYQPTAKLRLQLGLRGSYHTDYQAPLTYSVQGRWQWHPYWTLRGSYASGFRAPSLKERYMDFVDANHFIQGNADLKAERSQHLRLNLDYRKGPWQTGLNLFYNYIEDQITLQDFVVDSTGSYQPAPNASNQYSYFNLERYESLGADYRLSYQKGGWRVQLGAIYTGRYNSLSQDSEAVPRYNYTLEFSQQLSYHWAKTGWSCSIFRRDYDKLLRYAETYNPITQENEVYEYSLGAYSLMDLTVQKRFKKVWTLGAGVRNLLNVQTVASGDSGSAHSGGSGSMAISPGRQFFLQLRYNYRSK